MSKQDSTRKTEEKLDGRYKEGHEWKKPKWRPVGRWKQWSLGVGQRRKTFWNRYVYRGAPFWGLRQTYMNEWIASPRLASGSGDGESLSVGTLLWYRALWEKDTKKYIKRDVKMPCNRVSLSLLVPLGNLEGIRLPGLFEKREKGSISGFVSWTQRILRF
jgi:hypothetical protein